MWSWKYAPHAYCHIWNATDVASLDQTAFRKVYCPQLAMDRVSQSVFMDLSRDSVQFARIQDVSRIRCKAMDDEFYSLTSFKKFYGDLAGTNIFFQRVVAELKGLHRFHQNIGGLKTMAQKTLGSVSLKTWVRNNFDYFDITEDFETALLWLVHLLLHDPTRSRTQIEINFIIILLCMWIHTPRDQLFRYRSLVLVFEKRVMRT